MQAFKAGEYDLLILPEKDAKFAIVIEKIANIEGVSAGEIRKRLWRAIMPNVQSGTYPPSSTLKTGSEYPNHSFVMSFSGEVVAASVEESLSIVILHDISGV